MNARGLLRPAAAFAVVALFVIGAEIYRRHTGAGQDVDQMAPPVSSGAMHMTGTVLAGMRDLSIPVSEPFPAGHVGLRERLAAILEDGLDGNRARVRELTEIKKTLAHLGETTADGAELYLRGYMDGWDWGGGDQAYAPE